MDGSAVRASRCRARIRDSDSHDQKGFTLAHVVLIPHIAGRHGIEDLLGEVGAEEYWNVGLSSGLLSPACVIKLLSKGSRTQYRR
jgi:hypothetical protein